MQAESKKKGALARNLNRLLTPSSLALIAAWVVLFGLLFYVQQFAKELAPFDPFACPSFYQLQTSHSLAVYELLEIDSMKG